MNLRPYQKAAVASILAQDRKEKCLHTIARAKDPAKNKVDGCAECRTWILRTPPITEKLSEDVGAIADSAAMEIVALFPGTPYSFRIARIIQTAINKSKL